MVVPYWQGVFFPVGATRAYVLEAGRIVRSAVAAELLTDESRSGPPYLGGSVT